MVVIIGRHLQKKNLLDISLDILQKINMEIQAIMLDSCWLALLLKNIGKKEWGKDFLKHYKNIFMIIIAVIYLPPMMILTQTKNQKAYSFKN
jgi:hypothetical protein